MRIGAGSADAQCAKPPAAWKAVLLFGSNLGLVRERADACAKSVVTDLKDAFRISDLTGEQLRKDPARLADEAGAISMFGGRRVVRVRDATDGLADTFGAFLNHAPGDTLVVVEAGDLAKTSNLRKLFEGAATGAAVECNDDGQEDTGRLISEMLAGRGWKAEPDALAYLSESLCADRRLLRTEVDKLLDYLGPAKSGSMLTRAEAANVVGETGEVEGEDVANAVVDGDVVRLSKLFARGTESGLNWGVAVGFSLRLFQRLAAGSAGAGPMWGKMQSQAAGWDAARMKQAMFILSEAEARTRTTGFPEAIVAQQALMDVARRRPGPRRS